MELKAVSLYRISFILFLGILFGCQNSGKQVKQPPLQVKTQFSTATQAAFYEKITGYGSLKAQSSLDLEAKFDGIVNFKNLNGKIKKGEVIYTLTGPEVKLKQENLEKAFKDAQVQYDYLKKYYEAQKKLLKNNYLSKIDFENVSRNFQNAKTQLNNANYALNYFKTMTIFRAPFNGYLDNLQVPQGEDAVAGQLLATFQNDDHVKLEAPYYGNLNSLPVNLQLKINGEVYQGKITYIEKAINPLSGGHTIWVDIKDPEHHLKSGDYVPFSFLNKKHLSVAVPTTAIIQHEQEYYVVTLENKEYHKVKVIIGQEENGLTEIKSGIKDGTRVMTEGSFEVFYSGIKKKMKVED